MFGIGEYTAWALLSVLVVVVFDLLAGTKLYKRGLFWFFQGICFIFQTIFDGYLTWRPIYTVNPADIIGIYIFTIPLENYIFGFSMLYLAVIWYEFLKQEKL